MTGDRIFLLAFGAVLAVTRAGGIVAPGFFGQFAANIWRASWFRRYFRLWALVAMGVGALGLYLAWRPLTVQAIATVVLSAFLIVSGLLLFTGWTLRYAEKVIELVCDRLACRVLCSMAVVIGLLMVALALA